MTTYFLQLVSFKKKVEKQMKFSYLKLIIYSTLLQSLNFHKISYLHNENSYQLSNHILITTKRQIFILNSLVQLQNIPQTCKN